MMKMLEKARKKNARRYRHNRLARAENRDKAKIWREENPDKIKASHDKYNNTPLVKYKKYKAGAKRRQISWDLTIEQFLEYWQEPCIYCGDEIETIGLDRVNNDKGYSIDNIVPCCYMCNLMKRATGKEEFIKHCEKIVENCR